MDPASDRMRVPLLRTPGLPGGLDRDLLCHRFHFREPQPHAGEREEVDAGEGDGALEPVGLAILTEDDAFTFVVGGIGADTQLLGERVEAVLAGSDPGAAEVHLRPVVQVLCPDATADPIARLEHGYGASGFCQAAGCREPGIAGADDTELGLQMLHPVPSRLDPFPLQATLPGSLDSESSRDIGGKSVPWNTRT
jgi:hypothetical protein